MNESRRVLKNTVWLFSATLISALSDVVLFVLIARYLGPEQLGIFSFLYAIISILTVFSNLGLDTLIIRDIARENDKAPSFFSNIFILKIIMSLISMFVLVGILHWMNYTEIVVRLGALFSMIIVLKAVLSLNDAFFEAFERFEFMGALKILYSLMVVGIIWICLQFIVNLFGIVLVMILASSLCVILGWILLQRRMFPIKISINPDKWKSLLKEAYPFVFASFMGVMYAKTDILMLSKMVGNDAVGVYSAAYKIVNAYGIFPSILVMALFPLLSRRYKEAEGSIDKISNHMMRFLLIIGVPMVIFCTMESEKIIYLLYG
ncbi:MAG TPA: flippase, partial [Deltaproteobacteria bacterium]|nr:flippase [Deltaproteobacteria bacterium]